MNDPSPGLRCSGIRRSFGGGEVLRAHIQAAGKPILPTFHSWPGPGLRLRTRQQSFACGLSRDGSVPLAPTLDLKEAVRHRCGRLDPAIHSRSRPSAFG